MSETTPPEPADEQKAAVAAITQGCLSEVAPETCDCITRIHNYLRECGSNVRVSVDTIWHETQGEMDERVGIRWETTNGGLTRKGPARFAAKFCPFCGTPYDAPAPTTKEQAQ